MAYYYEGESGNDYENIAKKIQELASTQIKTGEIDNSGDIEIISSIENNQTIIYGKK